jgi:hypothetical protein
MCRNRGKPAATPFPAVSNPGRCRPQGRLYIVHPILGHPFSLGESGKRPRLDTTLILCRKARPQDGIGVMA